MPRCLSVKPWSTHVCTRPRRHAGDHVDAVAESLGQIELDDGKTEGRPFYVGSKVLARWRR